MKRLLRVIFALSSIILASQLECAQGADILVYGAVGTHSTRISIFPLMEALANKGHNVTFLSSYDNFEDPQHKSKLKYYTPEKWKQSMGSWEDHVKFFDIRKAGGSPQMWFNLNEMGTTSCQVLYSDPEFVNWVKTAKFDLVIMEYVVNECAFGLVHMFNAKLVVYGTSTVFPWVPDAFGLPDESSSITDVAFDFPPGDRMSFIQRVKNAINPILYSIEREYRYFPGLEEITRRGLGLEKDELPSFREIERNASLVLLTTHFTMDLPRSFPPHVIPVGGAVAGNKHKPLTKEMEDFINSAKSGFVFISFGTVAEFTNFDREVQLEFIAALLSFPDIKFLWKSSIPINESLPKNVMITKWAPQQTVLGHPKIKAFITHCGMGSATEVVHFAVPAILIPVLAEQDNNANALEARGAGIRLEITTLKKHQLEHAISEILNNNKYRLAMKKLSDAFKDRPTNPVDTAVWWIEYVMRHENSNDYLLPLSIRQPWWKRRQIDVWLTLGACSFLVLSTFLVVLFVVTKSILKKLFSSDNIKTGKLKRN